MLWYPGESRRQPRRPPRAYREGHGRTSSTRRPVEDWPAISPICPSTSCRLGRVVVAGATRMDWNAVQDAERPAGRAGAEHRRSSRPIDLELDDRNPRRHAGSRSGSGIGWRGSPCASSSARSGATTPTFDRVNRRGDTTLLVKFKNVNRVPSQNGPPAAFSGMIAPPMILASGPNPSVSAGPLGGLQPARHIAGFSIRKADGTEIPLIYDAAVGPSKDTVILRLTGKVPEGASLWYRPWPRSLL